ncbi:MAG: type II secretion system F family protein [Propioniciclava sp.]|uniref:type II secretion system F family protein n=1 Tax=Propioniciclava sp. TaxID=2038686 RepID=UPI0039E51629
MSGVVLWEAAFAASWKSAAWWSSMAAVMAAASAALAVWLLVPAAGLARVRPRRDRGGVAAVWRALAAPVRRRILARADREREKALRDLVPQVCELMAVCLEAGRPPRVAARLVASVVPSPAAEVWQAVLQRIDLGLDEAQAWSTLKDTPGYADIGRDLARSVRTGIGLAELLRQHAREARDRSAAAAIARARTAGVRSVVPLMMCFLPAFLLIGIVPLFGAFAAGLMG